MFNPLTSRRVFIQNGLAILATAPTIPTFLDKTMLAMAADAPTQTQGVTGKDGKILVIVQLSGGNDGLNTIVPHGDDAYHRLRPNIGFDSKNVLKIDNYLGMNPNLAPVKDLFDDGRMTIVQGTGYPNPNRSHFRSMDIWQSGIPERDSTTSGWLGRYFDNTCTGDDPHVGVGIGETAPLAMRGERILPLAFERPEQYRYNGKDTARYLELNHHDNPVMQADSLKPDPKKLAAAKKKEAEPVSPASQLDFLTRTAMDAQVSSDKILKLVAGHNVGGYPGGGYGNGLKTIAAMIKGNLPTRVYYVTLGGFDTHAGQAGRHDRLMQEFAQGIGAFMKDLKQQGNQDRVMVMTFSEFGRRVEQNASQGTDHGAAAPMFLFGPKLNPGVVGKHPSLTTLDHGDLMFNIDFRSVYATVLQDWLKTPSKPILGQQFQTFDKLIRA